VQLAQLQDDVLEADRVTEEKALEGSKLQADGLQERATRVFETVKVWQQRSQQLHEELQTNAYHAIRLVHTEASLVRRLQVGRWLTW
jgi:hypothetical protein